MAATTAQLDTSIEIITPENIAFRHCVAGPFRRLPAYLIDLLIRWLLAFAGLVVLGSFFGLAGLEGIGIGMSLVLWFLLEWFYGGLFETFFNGQTPGKRLMQIRVVCVDGQPINGLQAVLRNVLRVVDAQPLVFCQVGLLSAMISDRFQRLGDLVCGTMVVAEERQWLGELAQTGEAEAARMAALIPGNFRASRTLARALATYVQRRRTFSWGRRLELARHLAEPLQQELNLPADTNPDLLLCGLYHRVFITDRDQQPARNGLPPVASQSSPTPFGNDPAAARLQRSP
jgi:uncharacterized RDD family membrane protein YckC